jgi:hypothetical protein
MRLGSATARRQWRGEKFVQRHRKSLDSVQPGCEVSDPLGLFDELAPVQEAGSQVKVKSEMVLRGQLTTGSFEIGLVAQSQDRR